MSLKTPPTRRVRRWLFGGVVVVAVLGAGGPFLYTSYVERNNPPPLSLPAPTSAPVTAPSGLDGAWTVTVGSEAGYRVTQQLWGGERATTVGRTAAVTGSATVSGGQLTAATVTVELAKLATNSAERDEHVRDGILETGQFPTAVFTLAQPEALGTITPGQAAQLPAVGTLTIHGLTKPATVNLAVRQTGGTLTVQGSTTIAFADYGIDPPTSIDPKCTIEFLLQLAPA